MENEEELKNVLIKLKQQEEYEKRGYSGPYKAKEIKNNNSYQAPKEKGKGKELVFTFLILLLISRFAAFVYIFCIVIFSIFKGVKDKIKSNKRMAF